MEDKKTDKQELGVIRVPKSTHEAFKLFANENNLKLSEAADRVLSKSINSDDLLKKNGPIKLVEKVSDNTKAVKDLDKMFRSWMRQHEQTEIKVLREDLKLILSTMKNYPNAQEFKGILQSELNKLDKSTQIMNRSALSIAEKIDELEQENRELKKTVEFNTLLSYIQYGVSSLIIAVIIFL